MTLLATYSTRCANLRRVRLMFFHLSMGADVTLIDASTAGQTVFCNRFLSTRAQNGGVFEDVYDAERRLLSWGQMEKVDAARVQKTDVVLVECYIKRFKSRDGTNRGGWRTWAVNFEILRIAHILAGPGAPDLAPDDCAVDL